ncbi:RelE/StbE family addiction module toxin, partial [Carboxydocella sp. JDF658]
LDEIFDYIMVDNPSAADSILESIMHALSRLENFLILEPRYSTYYMVPEIIHIY